MPLYFKFKFYDDVRKRWARARYTADQATIASRYERWELIGDPEERQNGDPHNLKPSDVRPVSSE